MMLPIAVGITLFAALLPAQEGSLTGLVRASSGNPLAGVRVTARGAASVETRTDEKGAWTLSLPAGIYNLRFQNEGFQEVKLDRVTVPGTAPPVTLEEAQPAEAVRYRPVVDAERTHQVDFVTERQLNDLPVNRRNYLSLAALTPGVAEVNDYVGITDAPLTQAPQSGLSFGGNNGRGNVFWLDGGENYLNTGGVRPSISQEAVAEFHVDRSNYSAEFGGGVGGIVNIVSKTGGNAFHGDLFGFLRHRSVQARNYFYPSKGAYTRTQAGATAGGPIRKDRTFFFLSYERLGRQESAFVPLGRDRGPFYRLRRTQEEVAVFLNAAPDPGLRRLGALTEQLLLTTNFPATIALFDANRGLFPFGESNHQGSLRLDHRFSDNNNFFLRFNVSTGDSQNSNVEGFQAGNRGVVSSFSDQTLMLNDTYVLSPSLVSESRLSLNRVRFNAANRDQTGPSLDILGFGLFGKDWLLPSLAGEWHGQLQQNFFLMSGKHSLRFGTDINPVRSGLILRTNSGGRFLFSEVLPLGAFYNLVTGDPNAYANLAALFAAQRRGLVNNLDIPLTAIQSFNVGAPAFYAQNFGTGRWSGWFQRYNFFLNDVIRITPRFTLNAGVRYELEAPPSTLGTDANNISPRVGLAWSLTGDQKTVLRAGYGLFYLRHQTQLAAATELESERTARQLVVPLSGLPGSRSPLSGGPITSAEIYQVLSQRGVLGRRMIEESDLAPWGLTPGNRLPFLVMFRDPVGFRNGYAQQASVEVERALGATALSVSYNFNRGAHLPRLRNLNSAYGAPGPLGVAELTSADPLLGQRLIYESAANSFYHALFVQASRRYRRLTLNAHYTFSKSIDESTDVNFLPNDSLNARADRGLSTFDQRHRVVGSAVIDFRKIVIAPIVIANSGRPFNVVVGQDFNSRRPIGAGRNIGKGPSYFSADLRVSRVFALTERLRLEAIAEGFNLLNRTNFKRLNNTVDAVTVDDLPRPLTGVRGEVEDPLSFMSAFDPRQFQFALKFRW